ncbi:MAG: helix-turn-helix domain-containing protein [Fimbriimonadales bacterium]|nr:helix-turn-helix domain-containing protein [Fimbriimonadales bacterium]
MKRRERKRKQREAFALLAQGYTFKEAARAVGVHLSTVWRWFQRLPEAEQERILPEPLPTPPRPKPRVPIRMDCPYCGGQLEWRTGWSRDYSTVLLQRYMGYPRFRFIACVRCGFTSWRPLAPGQCRWCGRYLVWTRSRRYKVCPRECEGLIEAG